VAVSNTDAKSSVFSRPGSSSPETPARMRSTAATWSSDRASTIINSSSTPSENGALSPNVWSITSRL